MKGITYKKNMNTKVANHGKGLLVQSCQVGTLSVAKNAQNACSLSRIMHKLYSLSRINLVERDYKWN